MNRAAQAKEPQGFPGDDGYEPGEGDDVDDLLGAAAPSCTFPELGTEYEGVIVDLARSVQRDPNGEVRTFDNGDPRPQVIVTLQTELHDDDDDDGLRRLFVKGQMGKAFRDAMRRAHVRGPRRGGTVTVKWTGEEKPASKGLNPTKIFTVDYSPPAE